MMSIFKSSGEKERKSSFSSDTDTTVSTGVSAAVNVIFESFIMKKADDSKTRLMNPWKKRYMILTSDSISYAASASDCRDPKRLKGQITMISDMKCVKGADSCDIEILDERALDKDSRGKLVLVSFNYYFSVFNSNVHV